MRYQAQVDADGILERLRSELSGLDIHISSEFYIDSYEEIHFNATRQWPIESPSVESERGRSLRATSITSSEDGLPGTPPADKEQRLLIRVASTSRLERDYGLRRKLFRERRPSADHFLNPIAFKRLPARRIGDVPLQVVIDELKYHAQMEERVTWLQQGSKDVYPKHDPAPLSDFLDFATKASECCEHLHFGNGITHGGLRSDAFHYDAHKRIATLLNFVSAEEPLARRLLMPDVWQWFIQQQNAEYKLQFIAPEQTGRSSFNVDLRVDVYRLGIIFWIALTGRWPFEGDSLLEIVQNILSQQVPLVSAYRADCPHAIATVIMKMISRNANDRYNTVSAVKNDLTKIQALMDEADEAALADFHTAQTDVPCFLRLPQQLVGRSLAQGKILAVVDRVAGQVDRHDTYSRRPKHTNMRTRSSTRVEAHATPTPGSPVSTDDSPSFYRQDSSPRNISVTRQASTSSLRSQENQVSGFLDFGHAVYPHGLRRGSLIPQTLWPRSNTETVIVSGATGVGKSSLIESVAPRIRRLGYFASAKFEAGTGVPFDALINALASLFRQIFSVQDIATPFHDQLRKFISPFSTELLGYLGLPQWLLTSRDQHLTISNGQAMYKSDRRGSTISLSRHSSQLGTSNPTQDWLREGSTTSSSGFARIYIDTLRCIASQRPVCLFLDDLQCADEESIELLQKVVTTGVPICLISTFRAAEELCASAALLIAGAGTSIQLTPFSLDETGHYVTDIIHRSKEYCMPLIADVQRQTGGNPFLVREAMCRAYQSKIIYYRWKLSRWDVCFDTLLFSTTPNESEFSKPSCEHVVVRRFRLLPQYTRAFLAWAATMGNNFSIALMYQLAGIEGARRQGNEDVRLPYIEDLDLALQEGLQQLIIVPTDEEDVFRFSHDRYFSAADCLCNTFDRAEMHFSIVLAMEKLKQGREISSVELFAQTDHLCHAAAYVRERVNIRAAFRESLIKGAGLAQDRGARHIVSQLLGCCIQLLQTNPWEEGTDSSYVETLGVYTKSAESHWLNGDFEEANECLGMVFTHARTPVDQVPASMIAARIQSQSSDNLKALESLQRCLSLLDVTIPEMTMQECDAEFQRLLSRMMRRKTDYIEMPCGTDQAVYSIGAVFTEYVGTCFWTDPLLWYQAVLRFSKLYLEHGVYPHMAVTFLHFGVIAATRFHLIRTAVGFGDAAMAICERFSGETYVNGRVQTLHPLFLGHFQWSQDNYYALDRGLDATAAANDRILQITNLGISALFRVWTSTHLSEIDAFVSTVGEQFPDWPVTIRGGSMLKAASQFAKALQGNTIYESPEDILDDEGHTTKEYLSFLESSTSHPRAHQIIYCSVQVAALYQFGSYQEASKIGLEILDDSDRIWCMRWLYVTMFYTTLSLLARLRAGTALSQSDRTKMIQQAADMKSRIAAVCDVDEPDYAFYLRLIEAEFADAIDDQNLALTLYEGAIAYASTKKALLSEALSLELYSDWLVRRRAMRLARTQISACLSAYHQIGAYGKIRYLERKYGSVLQSSLSRFSTDMGTQTSDEAKNEETSSSICIFDSESREVASRHQPGLSLEVSPIHPSVQDSSLLIDPGSGLDVIDMAKILESSRLLSSELDVEKLLDKLTSLITNTTNAEVCGICVENEDGEWYAKTNRSTDDTPLPLHRIEQIDCPLGRQVAMYVLRSREELYILNISNDDRFSGSPFLVNQFPLGSSVIALPVLHNDSLLGCVYCQANPGAFSKRTLASLKIFVSQLAISLYNAFLFQRVKAVSAKNATMLQTQKHALAQAQEAEAKARAAEDKAMTLFRIKDEAVKVKSIFLANVSHELRTPLNGILGMAEMLLKETALDEEQLDFVNCIKFSGDSLLSIINGILDFSKLEVGKIQVASEEFSVVDTINDVVRAVHRIDKAKAKAVRTLQLLELPSEMTVLGDMTRLQQVLLNLLTNAFKFTEKGSVTITARSTAPEDAEYILVTFSVSDTGIGITPDQQQKLFTPFSQVDASSARRYGGTGLGLSICQMIVEKVLNGRISLESQYGIGTTVTFSAKFKNVISTRKVSKIATLGGLKQQGLATSTTAYTPSRRMSLACPERQLNVCVAEDNPLNQKIALGFLKKLGVRCRAFADGQQTLDGLEEALQRKDPFNLVLMDIQMPVMDGYSATVKIREHDDPSIRNLTVIAITASAIEGDREKCMSVGMNDYMMKPLRLNHLKKMLGSYSAI